MPPHLSILGRMMDLMVHAVTADFDASLRQAAKLFPTQHLKSRELFQETLRLRRGKLGPYFAHRFPARFRRQGLQPIADGLKRVFPFLTGGQPPRLTENIERVSAALQQ